MRLSSGRMHNRKSNMLIISSALLLNGAYLEPHYFFWCAFIFLLPLFYAVNQKSIVSPVKLGFVWGIVFFTVHCIEFFFLFFNHAQGSLRCALPLVIIVYFSLLSAGWFCLAGQLAKYFGVMSAWIFSTIAYFYVLTHFSFLIFGVTTGYCFGNPLVILAEHPCLVYWLPVAPWFALLGCIAVSSWLCALGIADKSWWRVLGAGLALLPFFHGCFKHIPMQHHELQALVAYTKPPAMRDNPLDCAQAISQSLQQALADKPNATIMCMPESSFPFPLNEYPEFVEMWGVNALTDDQCLLIGAHKKEQGELYNALFVVQGSRIMVDYVKNTRMFFTEYIPFPWSSFTHLQTLFLKNKKGFCTKKNCGSLIKLPNGISLQPGICSDLYLSPEICADCREPLVCIVNDSWWHFDYFKKLMQLFARYQAIVHERSILYIGHTKGIVIDKSGSVYNL